MILETFGCTSRKCDLTPTGCASAWRMAPQKVSRDAFSPLQPCVGCALGAQHAGEPPRPASTAKSARATPRAPPGLPQVLIDLEDAIQRGEHQDLDEPYPATFAAVLRDLLHRPGMNHAWDRLLSAHDKRIAADRKAFEATGGGQDVETLQRHPCFPVIAARVIHGDFLTATLTPAMPTRLDESGIHKAVARDARRLVGQIEKSGVAYPDSAMQAIGRIEARALLLAKNSISGPALLERSRRRDAIQITLCRLLVHRLTDWLGSPHYGTVAQLVSALLHKDISKATVQSAVKSGRVKGI